MPFYVPLELSAVLLATAYHKTLTVENFIGCSSGSPPIYKAFICQQYLPYLICYVKQPIHQCFFPAKTVVLKSLCCMIYKSVCHLSYHLFLLVNHSVTCSTAAYLEKLPCLKVLPHAGTGIENISKSVFVL